MENKMQIVWKNYYGFRKAIYDRNKEFNETYSWHDFKFSGFKDIISVIEEYLILGDISKVEQISCMKFEEVLSFIENRKDFKISSLTQSILGMSEVSLQNLVDESLKEVKEDQILTSKTEIRKALERAFYQGFCSSTYPGSMEQVVEENLEVLVDYNDE